MYFVVGIDNIRTKFSTLETIGQDESGWIKYYKDENDEKWEEILVDDRSFITILKKVDLPKNVHELMELCFSSNDDNDWKGIGKLFSLGDYPYLEIEKYFLENIKVEKRKRIIFLEEFRPIDNRDIVGKHFNDIHSSYEEYKRVILSTNNLCKG
jgi:hypothetical protein